MVNIFNGQKSERDISLEWDSIVDERRKGIESGKDKSFLYILKPQYISRLNEILDKPVDVIIDCGCGGGELSNSLSGFCERLIGIDISAKSIEMANRNKEKNVEFIRCSIEQYAEKNQETADICTLNMVLSNVINYANICSKIRMLLKKGGKVLITIPHPCYWPDYWGYAKEEWFTYKSQICMNEEFRITGIGNIGCCTHIHRPIEMYINTLIDAGFKITKMEELYSQLSKGNGDYPHPRFLYIECEK